MSRRVIDGLDGGAPNAAPSHSTFTSSEQVTLSIMSVMGQAYGALPQEFWDSVAQLISSHLAVLYLVMRASTAIADVIPKEEVTLSSA